MSKKRLIWIFSFLMLVSLIYIVLGLTKKRFKE